MNICIVGEGVVGTSTALALRQAFPQSKVLILSDRPFVDTSSFGPAGIFRVDSDLPRYRQWAERTFELWASLERELDPAETGVQLCSGHILSDDRQLLEKQERAMAGLVYNFQWMTDREIRSMFPNPSKYGIHFSTYAAEARRYVPWLRAQLEQLGGVEFKRQKVDSINQLVDTGEFSLIVNCAGLAAGKLAGDDDNVYPNRGIGLVVQAPGHKHFAYQNLDTFCLPLVGDRLLLGTLRQDGRWEREVADSERKDILERTLRLKPSLRGAKVIGEWCGLRPMRTGGVRLGHKLIEKTTGNGAVHVIHNYGHGSNGFVLSWGCAQEISELVKNQGILRANEKNKPEFIKSNI